MTELAEALVSGLFVYAWVMWMGYMAEPRRRPPTDVTPLLPAARALKRDRGRGRDMSH